MASADVERILEEARRLPPDEQRKLRDALAREPMPAPAYNAHERERAWIKQNRDEYLGQWVALDRDTIRYVPIDPFPGKPTGRSLAAPALFPALFLIALLHVSILSEDFARFEHGWSAPARRARESFNPQRGFRAI